MSLTEPNFELLQAQLVNRAVASLLDDELKTTDESPEYRLLAAFLQTAATPLSFDDDEEAHGVATIARAVSCPTPRPKRLLRMRASAKVAALATASVFAVGGAAAAATGSLPAPVQNAAAQAASHAGIEVPAAKHHIGKPVATNSGAHPRSDTCHAAQRVEDANGCRELATEHAAGQGQKADGTATSIGAKSENDPLGDDVQGSAGETESRQSADDRGDDQGVSAAKTPSSVHGLGHGSGNANGHQDASSPDDQGGGHRDDNEHDSK